MILIISGTNRPDSNTRKVASHVETIYESLGVEFQVPDGASAGFDGGHGTELAGQLEGEEPNSGVKVKRRVAGRVLQGARHEVFDEEPVHLKKRVVADAKDDTCRGVVQAPRVGARNALRAPVEEAAGHGPGALERVYLDLGSVGEQLDGSQEAREAAVLDHFTQSPQRLIDFRRRDRAELHRTETVRGRFQVADLATSQMKLGAVSIFPRGRRSPPGRRRSQRP